MQMLYRVPFFYDQSTRYRAKPSFSFLEVKTEFAPQPFENFSGLFLIIERKQYEARTVELFLHLVLFSIRIYKYDVFKSIYEKYPCDKFNNTSESRYCEANTVLTPNLRCSRSSVCKASHKAGIPFMLWSSSMKMSLTS